MRVFPLALIVVASLLATVATILYVTTRGEKLRTEAALAQAEVKIRTLESEAQAKKVKMASLEAQAADHASTRQRLAASEARAQDLDGRLAQNRNILLVREQNEALLNQEIAELKRKLTVIDQQAAEIAKAKARIDELEEVLALLHRKGISIDPNSALSSASILGVGPENSFVVINLGSKQGIKPNQKLLIRRGTDVIATVLISEVREDLSVAQVDPYLLREALRKGDSILLDQ